MGAMTLRFVLGGTIVTVFAMLGDILRPKSFAGLFGAAPSIALATLFLTVRKDGTLYAAIEARSMIFGAIGFFCYAIAVSCVLRRRKTSALTTTTLLMPIWFGVAFGITALLRVFRP